MQSETPKILMHVTIVAWNSEIKGTKDKRSKYIKLTRCLDKLVDKFPSIKSWIMLGPSIYMSEGRVTVHTMKRIRSYIEEKLGEDVLVLATKEVTELTKDIEVSKKVSKDIEMGLHGMKYVSDVKVFGGVYYITLPKNIAKSLKIRKGSKVVVWVRKA